MSHEWKRNALKCLWEYFIKIIMLVIKYSYCNNNNGMCAEQAFIVSRCIVPHDRPLALDLDQWLAESDASVPEISLFHRQSAWDRPLVKRYLAALMASKTSNYHQAKIKAVTLPHSGDWLLSLPISACGLRFNDDDIHTATGLRLEVDLCAQHECFCGTLGTADGSLGFSCRLWHGWIARHTLINDIIWRDLIKSGFPATLEPAGLVRSDKKRPDHVTLSPW